MHKADLAIGKLRCCEVLVTADSFTTIEPPLLAPTPVKLTSLSGSLQFPKCALRQNKTAALVNNRHSIGGVGATRDRPPIRHGDGDGPRSADEAPSRITSLTV